MCIRDKPRIGTWLPTRHLAKTHKRKLQYFLHQGLCWTCKVYYLTSNQPIRESFNATIRTLTRKFCRCCARFLGNPLISIVGRNVSVPGEHPDWQQTSPRSGRGPTSRTSPGSAGAAVQLINCSRLCDVGTQYYWRCARTSQLRT